jgi:hypothetical protein
VRGRVSGTREAPASNAAGRQATGNPRTVTQVVYTRSSGTILPELQWHERISIGPHGVVLDRNGGVPDTQVNAGRWNVPGDSGAVDALLNTLSRCDPTAIARIEPADPPDGGDTSTYTMVYAGRETLTLTCDPGTIYTGAEPMISAIDAMIQGLRLPVEARSLYIVA